MAKHDVCKEEAEPAIVRREEADPGIVCTEEENIINVGTEGPVQVGSNISFFLFLRKYLKTTAVLSHERNFHCCDVLR